MTRGFARILVPTDFSPPSEAALATARAMAARFGASIHLVHVVEDPYTTVAFATEAYGFMPAGVKENWEREAHTHLESQLTAADRTAYRATTRVIFGPIAQTIVDHAREYDMDLIVMGTHGRGGVAHLLLGSVAERVVRTAMCPVLTVRGTVTVPAAAHTEAEAVPVAV